MKSVIKLRNQISETEKILDWFQQIGTEWELSPAIIFQLEIVLEELSTNIISYAWDDQEDHSFEIELSKDLDSIRITFVDNGKAFNPMELPPAKTDLPLEERKIGGLGIHLVRQYMDHCEYQRVNDKNVFLLEKKIG